MSRVYLDRGQDKGRFCFHCWKTMRPGSPMSLRTQKSARSRSCIHHDACRKSRGTYDPVWSLSGALTLHPLALRWNHRVCKIFICYPSADRWIALHWLWLVDSFEHSGFRPRMAIFSTRMFSSPYFSALWTCSFSLSNSYHLPPSARTSGHVRCTTSH